MRIIVRTLSGQIFEIVRDQIISGKLGGERTVRQDALAAELGVSKIPLREALARVEQDGLLFNCANRGFFVRAMSAQEADKIFALRLSIEPDTVAAPAASDAERDEAWQACAELDRAVVDRSDRTGARNPDFHMTLVRPSKRLLTIELIERLHILSERYVRKHLEPAGRDDRGIHPVGAVGAALLRRRPG